jgi:nitrogen fixation protein FixH
LVRNLAKRYPIRGIALSNYRTKEVIQNSIAVSYHFTKPVNRQKLEVAFRRSAKDASQRRTALNPAAQDLRRPISFHSPSASVFH